MCGEIIEWHGGWAMLQPQQVEDLVNIVQIMDRIALTEHLLGFQGSFPVDFTETYLAGLSTDKLRHIFIALCLQRGYLPNGSQQIPSAA
jgi:hypothetical protein